MDFETAKQLLLAGKRIRRKAWLAGIYIRSKKSNIPPGDSLLPGRNFILLGGLEGVSATEWAPYLEDFFENDWEECMRSAAA